MAKEIPVILPDLRKVSGRLPRWGSSHTGRLPIAERLWAAAAELAREHGIFFTAKAWHLEYGKLKQRAEAGGAAKPRGVKAAPAAVRPAPSISPPRFVELMAPRPASLPSALVELEGPRGRMKIERKGVAPAERVALSRALWEGEA
jgi:hypothetical protein